MKDGTKPEFVTKLSDVEGHIGGNATFKIEFTGKPKPVAKWLITFNIHN